LAFIQLIDNSQLKYKNKQSINIQGVEVRWLVNLLEAPNVLINVKATGQRIIKVREMKGFSRYKLAHAGYLSGI
jgi:hypothetical protein